MRQIKLPAISEGARPLGWTVLVVLRYWAITIITLGAFAAAAAGLCFYAVQAINGKVKVSTLEDVLSLFCSGTGLGSLLLFIDYRERQAIDNAIRSDTGLSLLREEVHNNPSNADLRARYHDVLTTLALSGTRATRSTGKALTDT